MNTQWMGRYRPLIAALVQHANINLRMARQRGSIGGGISLTSVEWQVLEAIIESQGDMPSMIGIAGKLGIPQSTFSRTVKMLCDLKLVEKYQTASNRKNIILVPTAIAIDLYKEKADGASFSHFQEFFSNLDTLSNEDLETVVSALERFNAALDAIHRPGSDELIKID